MDFGNRNEMFEHAFNLKRVLDDVAGGETNFMILGDLNTMGIKVPTSVDGAPSRSDRRGSRLHRLREPEEGQTRQNPEYEKRLTKPEGTHFSERYGISDLDHIIASAHLEFEDQQNTGELFKYEVLLQGWRDFPEDSVDRVQYASDISDHCLLFCELKVE